MGVSVKLLTAEERAQIEGHLQGQEIVAITVAQLLFARPNPKLWTYSQKLGALVLARPKASGVSGKHLSQSGQSATLKLFEVLKDGELVWEHNLTVNSDYAMDRKHFHSLAHTDCMAGLNFADEFEAEDFGQKVTALIHDMSRQQTLNVPTILARSSSAGAGFPDSHTPPPAPSRPPPPAVRASVIGSVRAAPPPPSSTYSPPVASAVPSPPVAVSTPASSYAQPVELDRTASGRSVDANNSFFGFGKKPKGKPGKGSGGKISKYEISAPKEGSFRHLSHVGVSDGGFQMQGIPPEWKSLFQKAGLTEAQLQDKKNARFIRKFMEENQNKIAEMKTAPSRAPPPPPPTVASSTGRGPGPAPPPRASVMPPAPPMRSGSSVPPPPPPRTNSSSVSPVHDQVSHASLSAAGSPPPPPPPPPPPVGFAGGEARPPSPERKVTPRPPPQPVLDGRDNLMAAIRNAKGSNVLKPVEERQISGKDELQTAEEIENDLVAALSNALSMRKAAVAGDSDDEESENDDDWDD